MESRKKTYIYMGILILIGILRCNTNNNPHPFMEYILRPRVREGGVFYWGNIVTTVVLYIVTDKLWKNINWAPVRKIDRCMHPFVRQVIVIGLLAKGMEAGGESIVQLFKGFQNDLGAVYFKREESKLVYDWYEYDYNRKQAPEQLIGSEENIYVQGERDGKKVVISGAPNGYIVLKNCSKNTIGPFKIQFAAECRLDMADDIKKEAVYELPEEYILGPKEEMKINIENPAFKQDFLEVIDLDSTSKIKMTLVDDKEICIFESESYI